MVAAKGLEPNSRKQECARRMGLDVTFFDLENHTESYDTISMLNVFSHLPDPPAFIAQASKCLTLEGEILLETGDTAALSAEQHYKPFGLPDHLSFASEEIVRSILSKCGFKTVCVKKYSAFPLQRRIERLFKEFAKLFIPSRRSDFWRLYGQHRLSGRFITDMYIRARRSQ